MITRTMSAPEGTLVKREVVAEAAAKNR